MIEVIRPDQRLEDSFLGVLLKQMPPIHQPPRYSSALLCVLSQPCITGTTAFCAFEIYNLARGNIVDYNGFTPMFLACFASFSMGKVHGKAPGLS